MVEENEFDYNNTNHQSLLDKIFNPKAHLEEFARSMNGEIKKNNEWVKVRRSLAGGDFNSLAVMNLRQIIDPSFMMGNHSEEDFYSMLIESVITFLRAMLNERTVKSVNYMQIYLLYSNPLEMFAKLVIGGHASEMVKQILTQTYREQTKENANQGEFNLFAQR